MSSDNNSNENNKPDMDLLIRIDQKIDDLRDKLVDMQLVQVKQETNLAEHMRRTDLNEAQLDLLKTEVKPILESVKTIKILFSVLSFLVSILALYLKVKHGS